MNILVKYQLLFGDYLVVPNMDDYVINAKHGPTYVILFGVVNNT